MSSSHGRSDVLDIAKRRLWLSRFAGAPGYALRPGFGLFAWRGAALMSLGLLLAIAVGVSFHSYRTTTLLREEMAANLKDMEWRFQKMNASVDFESERQQLLLGIRDEILTTNSKLSLNEAYKFSEQLLRACEKYPSIDPLMLLSIGIVESRYDMRALSHADARGLYQIWPSTGRMLSRILGWEYTAELLYDPEANTEMAALYLDILKTAYNDWSLVLAEYNGGPLNAGYLRAGSKKTAPETRDYVPKVLKNFDRLQQNLGHIYSMKAADIHLDAARGGKRLWGDKSTQPEVEPTLDE